jgi:signal transduction histidine kinase
MNQPATGEVPEAARSRSDSQKELAEVLRQRAAISEVLRAIASSPHDLRPIFDTILDSAVHLCRAEVGAFRLIEEAGCRLVAIKMGPLLAEYVPPMLYEHGSFMGRLFASKSPVHIPDFEAEIHLAGEADRVPIAKKGIRTALIVPMLRNDELIGTLSLARPRVEPFTENEIELVTDFAAQTAIALEITRRERQYREVQTQLCHANRVAVVGQLTASIAHELRQPLGAVKVNGDAGLRWLTTQPSDLREVKLCLERAVESACRGSDIITGLMDLTKKQPLRKEPVDVNEAIQEVTVLTHGEADKHGVSLCTQLTTRLAHVEGDRLQLQQVVLNLTVNAIQAMSATEGGPRELLISTESIASGGVRVGVRDTGQGLSPESLPRLFEPFYTTKAGGMGMGLVICRSIIEAHGGRLWATACEPRGALFQFAIPASPGAAVVIR